MIVSKRKHDSWDGRTIEDGMLTPGEMTGLLLVHNKRLLKALAMIVSAVAFVRKW